MKSLTRFITISLLFLLPSGLQAQWQQLSLPTSERVISILEIGNNLFVGTYSGTFRSTDDGLTWSNLNNNGIPETSRIRSFGNKGNTILAASPLNGVYRSTDFGVNWELSTNGLDELTSINAVYSFGGNFYLGIGAHNITTEALFYSTDDGINWEARGNGILGTQKGVYSFASVGQSLFASVDGSGGIGKLYMTNDAGENWSSISPQGYGNPYKMLSISSFLIGAFFDLFRSSDFVNWVLIENGLPADPEFNYLEADDVSIYAAVYENGVYTSSDFGNSWSALNNGLPATAEVITLHRGSNFLYAGTEEHNLLRYPLTPTRIWDNKSEILDYKLSQNYPNPFNPSTIISWQSPEGSHQTLKVYDVLGNEVATLVNEFLPAGSYEVDFDAEGLSSGVYFYRLQAGDAFDQINKMILMK